MCITTAPQNPGSLADIIVKSKADGISTGTLKETEAYFGQFLNTRPTATGNLATTLEGQVNPALLTYQSRWRTRQNTSKHLKNVLICAMHVTRQTIKKTA